jgi:SAM-dependent methyltransferase
VHEILSRLPADALILDLGAAFGSFPTSATRATAIRVDRDAGTARNFVQADAAFLPFRNSSFAAIVSNHSLEHFDDLDNALREIGRVIRKDGALFVAVPDASTLTDRIYRWLGRGGGHVNAFRSAPELAQKIEQSTGLKHVATRTLCSSLSFLNRETAPRPLPCRLLLVGGGSPWTLSLYTWLSRRLDRRFGTRIGIYGWALYFGNLAEPIDTRTLPNVCIRCGGGHPASALVTESSAIPGIRIWRCPGCGTRNPFSI